MTWDTWPAPLQKVQWIDAALSNLLDHFHSFTSPFGADEFFGEALINLYISSGGFLEVREFLKITFMQPKCWQSSDQNSLHMDSKEHWGHPNLRYFMHDSDRITRQEFLRISLLWSPRRHHLHRIPFPGNATFAPFEKARSLPASPRESSGLKIT